MKMIVSYIRPSAVDDVLARLGQLVLHDVHYSEVRGYGRQKEHLQSYRDASLGFAFLPTLRLSLVIEDAQVEQCIAGITEATRTGQIGDGKILLLPVASAH